MPYLRSSRDHPLSGLRTSPLSVHDLVSLYSETEHIGPVLAVDFVVDRSTFDVLQYAHAGVSLARTVGTRRLPKDDASGPMKARIARCQVWAEIAECSSAQVGSEAGPRNKTRRRSL